MASTVPRDGRRVLTFRAGNARLATPADSVAEVFRRPRITRVPHAPPSLLGVAQLRGAALPIVSMARLLKLDDASESAAARVLLIDGAEPVGVLVDEITGLRAVADQPGAGDLPPGGVSVEDGDAIRVVDVLGLVRADFGEAGGRAPSAGRTAAAARSESRPAAAPDVALLTFALGEQLYALPLHEVAEVLPMPADVAALPRSEEVMLGLVPHRNRLLPIASLAALLGLASAAPPRRLVVARLGDAQVGLAVDELRAIRRVRPETISAVPALLNRGPGEARISAVARLGRGLASILAAERLFREETVARSLADTRKEVSQMPASSAPVQDGETFLIFRLGEEEYGLALAAVDEVIRLPEAMTRVPKAPAFVEGVINLRGRVVPVIDQHRRFAVPGAPAAGRRRVIVTTVDGRPAGFAVDAVSEILSLSPERIDAASSLAGDGAKLFDRVARLDDRMILLVDPRELLDRAERDLLAAMRSEQDREPA